MKTLLVLAFCVGCSGDTGTGDDADGLDSDPQSPVDFGTFTEDTYDEAYLRKYCYEHLRCLGLTGEECPFSFSTSPSTGNTFVCDFDEVAAQECIEAEWPCEASSYAATTPPLVCCEVCRNNTC